MTQPSVVWEKLCYISETIGEIKSDLKLSLETQARQEREIKQLGERVLVIERRLGLKRKPLWIRISLAGSGGAVGIAGIFKMAELLLQHWK